jgi:class 3 adenylate cyclase/tetratricopeptide (TPR) repeat protein
MAARKTVTVLFCDVADSTGLGERLDPEAVRAVMSRWYDAMRGAIAAHGGTVEKFVGDAVMAVFGVPTIHEDDALRAARAAVEMRTALAALNAELEGSFGVRLQIRIGVNTGEVVAGDPSTGQTFVSGDAVNVAKRLEQAARPGEVLLGAPTHGLIANAVVAEPRGDVEAKGKTGGVRAFGLLAVIAGAPAFSRRLDVRLVGRERELDRLVAELEATAADQACRLLTVLGAAGIGKSRLAAELATRSADVQFVTARCIPYGDGMTFWPLAQAIRHAGGIGAVEEALSGQPDAALVLERVRGAVETVEAPSSVDEIFWGIRRMLEALAREQPLVVCVEDVHWAEPTFLDLVEYVARWSRESPILLLCLARPDLLDERPGWTGMGATLELEPLSELDADTLLDELAAEWPLTPDARARIREAAEGNPLYVEQMVAMLDEQDVTATPSVPPTIQALLAARLDRLTPEERTTLERASVLGRDFTRGGLAELSSDVERGALGSLLLSLTRKDLIQPGATSIQGDDGYRFRHVLIRDAAYAGLPKEHRAALHEQAAGWLERAGAGDELVGYHLDQSLRFREQLGSREDSEPLAGRAGELLGRAGRRAFAREDMPAATKLLDRATQLLTRDSPDRAELLRQLSGALWWSGESARAAATLDELVESARESGDRCQEWYGLIERSVRRAGSEPEAEVDEILNVCADAIDVFAGLGDETGLARAWRRIAYAHQLQGRYGPAQAAATRALEHARAAGDRHDEARIVDTLCTCLLFGPAPVDDGVARCREMLEHAAGNRVMEANVLVSLAGLLAMRGEIGEARALVERAERSFEELGLRLALAGLTQVAGAMELLAGDPTLAERRLRRGLEILAGQGSADFQVAILAEATYRLGRYEEAARLAARGELEPGADDVARVVLGGVKAKLRARAGEPAVPLAREALRLADETDDLNLQGDALVNLAEVLAADGLDSDAQEALAHAVERYEAKGNLVAARRVSALLRGAALRP